MPLSPDKKRRREPDPIATKANLIGVAVEKNFPGYGPFEGTIVNTAEPGKVKVEWDNGEESFMSVETAARLKRLRADSSDSSSADEEDGLAGEGSGVFWYNDS